MKTPCSCVVGSRVVVAIALLLARPAAVVPQGVKAPSAALIGHWESVARSQGGIGTMLEFAPGGILVVTMGALVDTTYSLVGDTAVVPAGAGAQLWFFFRNDTLVVQDPQVRRAVPMRRLTAPQAGAAPLVGRWTYVIPDSVPVADPRRAAMEHVWLEFTADKVSRLRFPFRSDTLAYRISGDTLVAIGTAPSGGPAKKARYVVADSTLTLVPITGGLSGQFRRAR